MQYNILINKTFLGLRISEKDSFLRLKMRISKQNYHLLMSSTAAIFCDAHHIIFQVDETLTSLGIFFKR